MLNLLPQKTKDENVKHYRWKIFVLSSCFLIFLFFLIIGPLFAGSMFLKNVLNELVVSKGRDESYNEIAKNPLDQAMFINQKIKILLSPPRPQSLTVNISPLLDEIINKAKLMNGESEVSKIKIAGLAYESKDELLSAKGSGNKKPLKKIHKVNITGVALDRESLLGFIKLLDKDDDYKSVESPVSSFISSKDLPFSITLIISDKNIIPNPQI